MATQNPKKPHSQNRVLLPPPVVTTMYPVSKFFFPLSAQRRRAALRAPLSWHFCYPNRHRPLFFLHPMTTFSSAHNASAPFAEFLFGLESFHAAAAAAAASRLGHLLLGHELDALRDGRHEFRDGFGELLLLEGVGLAQAEVDAVRADLDLGGEPLHSGTTSLST